MKNNERKYAVLDVETTMIKSGEYPRTLFWGYADENGYKRFESTKKLLTFLKYETEELTLLHHSNFDVLQLLLDGANVQILRSHNTRLIRCKIFKHILLNSYSCFPIPLAKVFECYGYKKTPLQCPSHEHNEEGIYDCPDCQSLLAKRNYEDCVNGLTCFLKLDETFTKLVEVSPLQRGTIAGTSFTAAQNCAGAKLPEDTRYLEAYRGGRVEVYNTNKTTADKYDINSSYPFSILDTPRSDTILLVRVSTKDNFCPLYDVCVDDCLLFPNGHFLSYTFESNLERYLKPHWSKTTIKVIKKEKIDFSWLCSLRPLIEKLYRLKNKSKLNGEQAIETACKLLLNSMYGRIGLKGESERARFMDYRPDGDEVTTYKLNKKFLVFDTIHREVKSNYPFAAYITDNARARLYRAFVGSKAYYGDTDSVMTPTGKPYFDANEKQGNDCGEWKHEGRDTFKANNVKDYFWGDEEVRKGGSGFTQWTLKTLASGKKPVAIERERISELKKRITTFSGETLPVVVDRR